MFLLDMLSYGFMQRAFAAGLLIGCIAPLVGVFLVTRRYAFMAETLAHVSLAGVALGVLAGVHPLASALAASLLAAFCVEQLRSRRALQGEAALALFLSGGLALSSVLLSTGKGGLGLQGLLFGSITTVTASDLIVVALLAGAVAGCIAVVGRGLFAVSLDEELAVASGLPVGFLNVMLAVLAAVTVAVSIPLVGALLVGALMVIPVVSAMQWRGSFRRTIVVSILLSLLSVVCGLVLSYRFGVPSGGVIVLMAIGLFLLSAAFGRRQ
jgi:zinc transport system permease protein